MRELQKDKYFFEYPFFVMGMHQIEYTLTKELGTKDLEKETFLSELQDTKLGLEKKLKQRFDLAKKEGNIKKSTSIILSFIKIGQIAKGIEFLEGMQPVQERHEIYKKWLFHTKDSWLPLNEMLLDEFVKYEEEALEYEKKNRVKCTLSEEERERCSQFWKSLDPHYQEKDFYFNPYLSDGELMEKLTGLSKKDDFSSMTENAKKEFLKHIESILEKFRMSRSIFLHHSKGTFALFLYEMCLASMPIHADNRIEGAYRRTFLLSERGILPGKSPVSFEEVKKTVFPITINDQFWIYYYFEYISTNPLRYLRENRDLEESFTKYMMWLFAQNVYEGDSDEEKEYSRLTLEMQEEWHKESPDYETLTSLHRKRSKVFLSETDRDIFERNIFYLQNSKEFLRNKENSLNGNGFQLLYLMLKGLNKKRDIYELLLHVDALDEDVDDYDVLSDLRSRELEISLEEDREYCLLIKMMNEKVTAEDNWELVNHLFNNNTWEEVEQKIDTMQERWDSRIKIYLVLLQVFEKYHS